MEKTNEKRNRMKRIMLMLCAAVVAISTVLGSGVTEVQAASKAKKAMAAYEKLLRDSDNWVGYTTFGLIDVNRDGIKELVVYDEGTNSTSLIGYVSGKTKYQKQHWYWHFSGTHYSVIGWLQAVLPGLRYTVSLPDSAYPSFHWKLPQPLRRRDAPDQGILQ